MRVANYGKLTPRPPVPGKAVTARHSNSTTVVSPVGGLNARDPLANMDSSDAVALTNIWPGTSGCSVRLGYQVHAKLPLDLPVETIAEHANVKSMVETGHLYAFAGDSMFDASSPGVVTAAALLTGLTSARWQSVNYPNQAGVHFVAVNGLDDPIWVKPDNTVARLTAGNGTDPGTISGVDPKTFNQVILHQRRLWFVQKGSCVCWYLPVEQVYGVAQSFDFGPLFKRGGFVVQQFAWTVDAGNGPNDCLVTLSLNGEVAVYQGTDPANASTWGLSGVFYVGAPVGRRCMTRLGGDVAIICMQGLASLNATLTSTTVNTRQSFFSDKVQSLISGLTWSDYLVFGWEPFVFPGQNMLLLNVPNVNGNYQLAMNTITGAWTVFQGLQAWSWSLFMQRPHYGSDHGVIYEGLVGFLDGVDTFSDPPKTGNPIDSYAVMAFNYFTAPGMEKQFLMVRPTFVGAKQPDVSVKISLDFTIDDVPYPPITQVQYTQPLWDQALWDKDRWFGQPNTWKQWYNAEGMSYAAAFGLRLRTISDMSWTSVDWVIDVQKGNAL